MIEKIDIIADNRAYTVNLKSGKVVRYVADHDIEGYELAGYVLGKKDPPCRSCRGIPFYLAGLAVFMAINATLVFRLLEARGSNRQYSLIVERLMSKGRGR